MDFKCLVVTRNGEFLRYRYGYLPDGSKGHQGSPNCNLFVSENALPYYAALDSAHPVHVTHVPYQHEMLEAQGYTPVWVPCL